MPTADSLLARARKQVRRARSGVRYRLTTRPATRRAALVGLPERWEAQRRFQFEFLTAKGLLPEHRLLDIGCGALRGGIPAIDYLDTGHYTGVEARSAVLREARKELAEAGLEHKRPLLINASDPGDVKLETPVDFAWAFMVMIHLPDELASGYLALVSEALTPGGEFYGNVNVGERPEGNWQGFPVVWRPIEFYEGLAASHGLAVSSLGTLESLGHKVGAVGDRTVMLRFTRASA
jgi:hypothetical protein